MKLSDAMKYVEDLKKRLENGEASPAHVAAAVGILRADASQRSLALKTLLADGKRPSKALVESAEG
jgi:hypothetical protein